MIFFYFSCILCCCAAGCYRSSIDAVPLHTVPEVPVQERMHMQKNLESVYVQEKGDLERDSFLEKPNVDPVRAQGNTLVDVPK